MNVSSATNLSRVEPLSSDTPFQYAYQKLTRDHLKALPRLFHKLTGLRMRVAWAPAWPFKWKPQDLPTPSLLCRRRSTQGGAAWAHCQRCGNQHLSLTLKADHEGHYFNCHQGIRNFWFAIMVRQCPVGIAFVQAPVVAGRFPAGGNPSPTSMPSASKESGLHGCSRAGGTPVSQHQFRQAGKLLRLIFEYAQTSTMADLREEDFGKAQQAVRELRTVVAGLRVHLNSLAPAIGKAPPVLRQENHTQAVVHALLERMQQECAWPISLKQCARELRLNASYLSALFSRTVGMPFKTFLTELQVERARQLLSDPARSISEVAFAVGYADENRFRAAFKRATGLPPKVWRETLIMAQSGSTS